MASIHPGELQQPQDEDGPDSKEDSHIVIHAVALELLLRLFPDLAQLIVKDPGRSCRVGLNLVFHFPSPSLEDFELYQDQDNGKGDAHL
jgi:hypothetical protein